MTKAQQIRSRRLMSIQKELTKEAEKVFDWILDLIDSNTIKGDYRAIEVFLFYDQYELRTKDGKKSMDLSNIFLKFNRKQFFTTLKEIIEQEEGFKVDINTEAMIWESKAISCKVFVE